MTHLLDKNACIGYLNGRAINLRNRLAVMPSDQVVVCSIVKAEMFSGAMKSVQSERTLANQQTFLSQFVSLSFADAAAEIYGDIRAYLETRGTPIGPYDLQIAAIALANSLTLVTHNTREFSRVPGLRLEDWEV